MKLLDFAKHFDSEEACEKYLKETREKEGIKCSRCGCEKQYWNRCHKRWMCAKCGHETTLRSGTVMHGSNLPLLYWFTAIHLLTSTKKTFSAAEMQRQLGHKRYQPIWEMMHKLRSVMGERDSKYNLEGTIELDEGYFTRNNDSAKDEDEDENQKRGLGSQRKSKVLVMVESEKADNPKPSQKSRKCGHLKMKVITDLKGETLKSAVECSVSPDTTAVMDNFASHSTVEKAVLKSERQTVRGCNAPKVLPWVHIAISNAKSLFTDMYHGIKEEFLQEYLNEFCYKFNRKYFGDRMFDRLVIAAVSYKPTFEHKLYNGRANCG